MLTYTYNLTSWLFTYNFKIMFVYVFFAILKVYVKTQDRLKMELSEETISDMAPLLNFNVTVTIN